MNDDSVVKNLDGYRVGIPDSTVAVGPVVEVQAMTEQEKMISVLDEHRQLIAAADKFLEGEVVDIPGGKAELLKKARFLGKVIHPKGGRRRYVVSLAHFLMPTDPYPSYNAVALSGGEKGCHPSGMYKDMMDRWELDADQTTAFNGPERSKLKRRWDEDQHSRDEPEHPVLTASRDAGTQVSMGTPSVESVTEGKDYPPKYNGEGAWKMTMDQWKNIHRDFKGNTDGKRSALTLDPKTGGTISVPVEIVKPTAEAKGWQCQECGAKFSSPKDECPKCGGSDIDLAEATLGERDLNALDMNLIMSDIGHRLDKGPATFDELLKALEKGFQDSPDVLQHILDILVRGAKLKRVGKKYAKNESKIPEGRSVTYPYRVEFKTASGVHHTSASWRVNPEGQIPGNGKPTPENLAKYIDATNKSFEPGGVNAHIGSAHEGGEKIVSAKLVRQADGAVVATWAAKTESKLREDLTSTEKEQVKIIFKGYDALGQQYIEEPDKRGRIADFMAREMSKVGGPEKGQRFGSLLKKLAGIVGESALSEATWDDIKKDLATILYRFDQGEEGSHLDQAARRDLLVAKLKPWASHSPKAMAHYQEMVQAIEKKYWKGALMALADLGNAIRISFLPPIKGESFDDVAKGHQTKIAKDTLRMNDAMARIMGGMSKDQARAFLKSIGWSDERIAKLEGGKTEVKIKPGQKATPKNFCFLLTHKLTAFDRRQQSKPGYNHHALAHYMGAVSDIEAECKSQGILDGTEPDDYEKFIRIMKEHLTLPPADKLATEIRAYVQNPGTNFKLESRLRLGAEGKRPFDEGEVTPGRLSTFADTYCGKSESGEAVMVRPKRGGGRPRFQVDVGPKTVASDLSKDEAAQVASGLTVSGPWSGDKKTPGWSTNEAGRSKEAKVLDGGQLRENKTKIGRWQSRGGKYWVELFKYDDGSGYSYSSDDGGGNMGALPSDEAAIAELEKKLHYLTPDAHKNLLKRVESTLGEYEDRHDYYAYPNAGWWNTKEDIAKKMTVSQLHYARLDCDKAARSNPDVEGKYRDEGSIYIKELDKRKKAGQTEAVDEDYGDADPDTISKERKALKALATAQRSGDQAKVKAIQAKIQAGKFESADEDPLEAVFGESVKVRLLRFFWGHPAGTRGELGQTADGRKYLKLPGSPRAFIKLGDKDDLYAEEPGKGEPKGEATVSMDDIFGADSVSWSSIPVGGKFTFPKSPEAVHMKKSEAGWYTDARGKKWKTGTQVRVVRVKESTIGESEVAQTILSQISTSTKMAIGLRRTMSDGNTLIFQVGSGNPVKKIAITLDPSDTYSIKYSKVGNSKSGYAVTVLEELDDVYAEDLSRILYDMVNK